MGTLAGLVLALTENENVALLGATGLVGVAIISSVPALLARKASNTLSEKVGEPNGKGNVMEILHKLLDGQVRQDERISKVEERTTTLELGRIENSTSIGELRGRIAILERYHLQEGIESS